MGLGALGAWDSRGLGYRARASSFTPRAIHNQATQDRQDPTDTYTLLPRQSPTCF